jgi:CheY-like chemotaxis protein/HPt (histidine-containing phosphotransfer) domain-containing protein
VESELGHGSKFRFTARFARSVLPEGVTTSPGRLTDLRVLIVDDNETHQRMLEEQLTSWRMQPTAVSNAMAAMDALRGAQDAGNSFALVLIDARMPEVGGVTFAGDIQQHWGSRAPRLILLSSAGDPELLAESRLNGVLAFLLKPVKPSELLEAIWWVMSLDLTLPNGAVESEETPVHLAPLNLLVAEDNDLNVAVLEGLLRRGGHHAEFARDGRAALELALELASEDACDVMLLDLHMPGLDGFQVARAIREREQGTDRHLPIIALTARSSVHDRERCIAAGIDEFLAKPIEAAALWAAVGRLVRARSRALAVSPDARWELLDPRAILRACDGQAALLEKLVVVLRNGLPIQMARVRTALGQGDFPSLREAAHRLAGTAGEFSTVTADIAMAMEDEAIRQDLEACTALVERLGSMCDALLEETTTLSIDSLKS